MLRRGVAPVESDIWERNGQYQTWKHHSQYTASDRGTVLHEIQVSFERAREAYEQSELLMITFGSAWEWIYQGTSVNNCHKVPQNQFERKLAEVNEMFEGLKRELEFWMNQKPGRRCIVTVSPVRHGKNAIDNNRAKAPLHLLAMMLESEFEQVAYFPAFEIVNDELRDYRFFDDDMIHPSPMAIEYIWERFKETYLHGDTHTHVVEIEQLKRDLNHRPFRSEGVEYDKFIHHLNTSLQNLKNKWSQLDWSEEESEIKRKSGH